ncbi:MAG: CpXC domain-containing protein [bacterium]|nr:CpXC domain-containing protein [bacterium]
MSAKRIAVQCPNCRNTVNASVRTIVDPAEDPEGKMQLVSGTLNTVRCPNCGSPIAMASPVLYHDASKDLLVSYVPMELNMPRQQAEKAVGDLMRELTARIPQQEMRGYLFQPKSALTMPGLIEMVLNADGVTKEMIEEQKARARLAEQFIQAPNEQLEALVRDNDDKLDSQFFSTLTLMAQRLLEEGQRDLAQHIMQTQQAVMSLSSFGRDLMERSRVQEQVVQEVAAEIQAMNVNPAGGVSRDDFMELVLKYADDEDRLEALVGLARPAFDYQFFQDLTLQIGQAPAEAREGFQKMRDHLLALTARVDQQMQMELQEAASLLRTLLSSPDPDALLAANLDMLDDTFLAVLQANIQEADRVGEAEASARLKTLYQKVVNALRQTMQPELRFINDLLAMPDDDEARQAVIEGVGQYGDQLLDLFDAVGQVLSSRGEPQLLERLALLRDAAETALHDE